MQGQCGGWEPRQDTVLRVQAADDLGLREWREVKPERWMPELGEQWGSQGRAVETLGLWGSASVLPSVTACTLFYTGCPAVAPKKR